jgi:hypothetical protein
MKRLAVLLIAVMLIVGMTPVFGVTAGLTVNDFKDTRKLLVEMFLEPE